MKIKWLVGLGIGGFCICATGGLLFMKTLLESDWPFGGEAKGLDPAKTLLEITGLSLPKAANVIEFKYQSGLDDYMKLRFEAPKEDALAFSQQKPFLSWDRKATGTPASMTFWEIGPKSPYRFTGVELPHGEYLNGYIEEREVGPWIVWISWHES